MARPVRVERVLDELRRGRRFRERPAQKHVEAFIRHIAETGAPHLWPLISTTTPSSITPPILLQKFRLPDRFRNGLQSRAPCPICCPFSPKYESGYLAWHPDDGLIRAIGHECGREFFEGDSFSDSVNLYEAEQVERAERDFLLASCHKLSRLLVERWVIRIELCARLRTRDELVASLTKKAVHRLTRSLASNGTLTIDVNSGSKDHQGRAVIEKRVLGQVSGGKSLVGGADILLALERPFSEIVDDLSIVRDDRTGLLEKLTPREAINAAQEIRRLFKVVEEASALNDELRNLLTIESLAVLSRWGQHKECPHPFWIANSEGGVHLGKGIKPIRLTGTKFICLPLNFRTA